MPVESPELIERKILATRLKLTDKVGELNDRTVGRVHDTAEKLTGTLDAATDTFEQVSESVAQIRNFATVDNIGQTLQDCVESIPLTKAVANHPWTAVAGAAAVGFVLGTLASRAATAGTTTSVSHAMSAPGQPVKPSLFSELIGKLTDRIGTEVRTAAEQALNRVGEQVQERVKMLIPDVSAPQHRSI